MISHNESNSSDMKAIKAEEKGNFCSNKKGQAAQKSGFREIEVLGYNTGIKAKKSKNEQGPKAQKVKKVKIFQTGKILRARQLAIALNQNN